MSRYQPAVHHSPGTRNPHPPTFYRPQSEEKSRQLNQSQLQRLSSTAVDQPAADDTDESKAVSLISPGSLLPSSLTALLCGSGSAAAMLASSSSTGETVSSSSLQPYPRHRLQIVSERGGRYDAPREREVGIHLKSIHRSVSSPTSSTSPMVSAIEGTDREGQILNGTENRQIPSSEVDVGVSVDSETLSYQIPPSVGRCSPVGIATSAAVDLEDDGMSVTSVVSTAWSDISGFEDDISRMRSMLQHPVKSFSGAEGVDGALQKSLTSAEGELASPAVSSSSVDHPSMDGTSGKLVSVAVNEEHQLQLHRYQLKLQNVARERDVYRQQLEALQKQIATTSQRQHFDTQRQKAHLEGLLEVTRRELEEVRSERNQFRQEVGRQQGELKLLGAGGMRAERDALLGEVATMRVRVREADRSMLELQNQAETRQGELAEARHEIAIHETAANEARMELDSARTELQRKETTIQSLKNQVSGLKAESQHGLQHKLQAEHVAKSSKQDIERFEKSLEWHKQQMRIAQEGRIAAQQELSSAQNEVISLKNSCERLRAELVKSQLSVSAVQSRAVREKETLMRHLENIRIDMVRREKFFDSLKGKTSDQTTSFERMKELSELNAKMCSMELCNADLQQQLDGVREERSSAVLTCEQLKKDGQARAVLLVSLQEKLRQQNALFDTLKSQSQEALQEQSTVRAQLKEKNAANLVLKEEKTQLEVALAAANQEKRNVDEAVKGMNVELKKVSLNFYKLKSDSYAKDKKIEEIQSLIAERDRELRVMNEQLREHERLKVEVQEAAEKMAIFGEMNVQNKNLMVKNHELQYKVQQLGQDRNVLEQARRKLEEVVRSQQQQLNKYAAETERSKMLAAKRDGTILSLEDDARKMQEEMLVVKKFARNLHRSTSEISGESDEMKRKRQVIEVSSASEKEVVPEMHLTSVVSESESSEGGNSRSENLSTRIVPDGDANRAQSASRSSAEQLLRLEEMIASLDYSKTQVEDKLASTLTEKSIISDQLTQTQAELERARSENQVQQRFISEARPELVRKQDELSRLNEELDSVRRRNKQLMQEIRSVRGTPTTATPEQTGTDSEELVRVREVLSSAEAATREHERRYRSNIRVLTRKLYEYMRMIKAAEQELARLRECPPAAAGDTLAVGPSALQLQIVQLEEQLAAETRTSAGQRRDADQLRNEIEQLRARSADSQTLTLELDKERGRLEGMSQAYSGLQTRAAELEAVVAGYELQRQTAAERSPAELRQLQERVQEQEVRLKQADVDTKELRRQLFAERRELSTVRQQLSSVRSGLQTADELVERRGRQLQEAQLERTEAVDQLRSCREKLNQLQTEHQLCAEQAAEMRRQTEQAAANQPLLAAQIKTLSGHLHQKTLQLEGLQEQAVLVEQRHSVELSGLQSSLSTASQDLAQLKSEVESVRQERFALQTQCAELGAALQITTEQARELRAQVSYLDEQLHSTAAAGGHQRAAVTGCRPPAPRQLDEAHVSRLLELCRTPAAEARPLDDLQICLSSLRKEMHSLQTQIDGGDETQIEGALEVEGGLMATAVGSGVQQQPCDGASVASTADTDNFEMVEAADVVNPNPLTSPVEPRASDPVCVQQCNVTGVSSPCSPTLSVSAAEDERSDVMGDSATVSETPPDHQRLRSYFASSTTTESEKETAV